MSDRKGRLFVVTGPSGAGKGTVLAQLFNRCRGLHYSVSMTTRKPRPGETEGSSYYFVTDDAFRRAVENGELLEHAEYVGNCYGTPLQPVIAKLAEGLDVILEIEIKGAMQVKAKRPDAILIFILPPSQKELRKRLEGRGTETPENIGERLLKSKEETPLADQFDHIIVNKSASASARKMASIIENYRTGRYNKNA